jgi:hypothetical protein
MKKVQLFLLSMVLCIEAIYGQKNSAEIYTQLKQMEVLGSVLYIAAHPDDENNAFLPYLTKERHYRTAYLSLTRGDGGQNLIGKEQGVELEHRNCWQLECRMVRSNIFLQHMSLAIVNRLKKL